MVRYYNCDYSSAKNISWVIRFLFQHIIVSAIHQHRRYHDIDRWWQTTMIDIIRPGVGWHAGAKMVKEQVR